MAGETRFTKTLAGLGLYTVFDLMSTGWVLECLPTGVRPRRVCCRQPSAHVIVAFGSARVRLRSSNFHFGENRKSYKGGLVAHYGIGFTMWLVCYVAHPTDGKLSDTQAIDL
jgi:hypothetical protein